MNTIQTNIPTAAQPQRPSRSERYAQSTTMRAFFQSHRDLLASFSTQDRVCWSTPATLEEVKYLLWQELRASVAARGGEAKPLAAYAEVAEWLKDNQGRGLLLYGSCGLGKTLLARHVLPKLVLALHRRVFHTVDAVDVDANLREYSTFHLISIDDLGTEPISQYRNLGFGDLLDRCEKKGGLMIVTTNLTGEQLRERYGDRIYDRLIGLTRRVLFTGKSFRE